MVHEIAPGSSLAAGSVRADGARQKAMAVMSNPTIRLSRRQREVLEWTAMGKTDWEISAILRITERSVKFHLEQARKKLDAANRTHAVARAILLGLIDIADRDPIRPAALQGRGRL
jgi:DNA-binding CsgD family transcriptional regulator